jgi:hypothetical protein
VAFLPGGGSLTMSVLAYRLTKVDGVSTADGVSFTATYRDF